MKRTAMITATAFMATMAEAGPVGFRALDIEMPHHERSAPAALWYPAGPGGAEMEVASHPVFHLPTARGGAPLAEGQHPMIILSHGFGGSHQSISWLASGLAERGAIVVALSHINSTFSAFDITKAAHHWTRAWDMTVALDMALGDVDLAPVIDPGRIMAAGFSYGGWSALSLGGMRANHAGIVDTCKTMGAKMSLCPEMMSDVMGLPDLDPEIWNASYADARVTHVAAIDPGFVWGLDGSDVAGLVPQVSIIGLGSGADRFLATDFDQSGLAQILPGAEYLRIDPATHFTAMPVCTAQGPAILKAEGDDPVCTDPAGTDRAAVHARIIEQIAGQLGL